LTGLRAANGNSIPTKTASSATETFLYAGQMLVGEYDSSGNILARYIPGPGQDEAALWYSGSGVTTPQWLHADQQNSTIAWSNGSGAAVGTQAYDPYGQPQAWSGPRFAYTGQLMIAEAQLYHYKARAYDPALGRFLQTDPAGYASDVNSYAYAGNDPVDGIDPSGMVDAPCTAATCQAENTSTSTSVGELVVVGQSPPTWQQQMATTLAEIDQTATQIALLDATAGINSPSTSVSELVVMARRKKSLAGVSLNFNLPFPIEQYFIINSDFVARMATVMKVEVIHCGPDKDVAKQVFDPSSITSTDAAIVHTHPSWGKPFPGPGDAVIPLSLGIPNYGISPFGAWVVMSNGNGGVTATLISGTWGDLNFSPSDYGAPGGNSGTGTSQAALCNQP
jgi:RHS repeat-associated protein